ncbi:hypothetical protein G7Y79_00001g003510 [Physcia stellaris]|nr:hypothetical protein G7Y79_00001g003510 [Physcia stellaris]
MSCEYVKPLDSQLERSLDVSSVNKESIIELASHSTSTSLTEWQTSQSNRYERLAMEQQRLALQTYIPNVCDLSSHNEEALCAASALLSLNAIASTQKRHYPLGFRPQDSSPIDDWLEISVLVRGVNIVVQNASTSMKEGIMQPLLTHRRVEDSKDGVGGDVESQIRRLVSPHVLSALDTLASVIDQYTSIEADKEIFHEALRYLRASFAIVAANPEHESIVMVWSNLLDPQFFPLVKRREPIALILLAYWTVMLRMYKDRWWVGGLSITILRHVAVFLISRDARNRELKAGSIIQGACTSTDSSNLDLAGDPPRARQSGEIF